MVVRALDHRGERRADEVRAPAVRDEPGLGVGPGLGLGLGLGLGAGWRARLGFGWRAGLRLGWRARVRVRVARAMHRPSPLHTKPYRPSARPADAGGHSA